MLPSITSTTFLLLLVFCIGAASSTEGRGSKQMLPPAVLPEITLEGDGVTTVEVIDITLFKWLYDMKEDVTNLTICAAKNLIGENEDVLISPTLVYQLEGGRLKNIEGHILDRNSPCSLFTEIGNIPLALNETVYQLSLIATNESSTIYRSGTISFGMPVETSTLSCHSKIYTRAVALLTSNITFDHGQICFDDDQQLSNDSVCYLEGEFSSSYLCYTTDAQPELQVCLQGSSLANADEVDGQLEIKHLAYESSGDTLGAHLSLEFGNKSTDGMEVIIWKEDMIFASICLDTKCSIPAFASGFVHYDVCAVMLVGGRANTTSTDNITDLDADAFVYNDSTLLQFDYINANDGGFYMAYVVNDTSSPKPVDNAPIDCSAVPANKKCHGYFTSERGDDLWVAVEYSDADMTPKGNMIVFKCQLMKKSTHGRADYTRSNKYGGTEFDLGIIPS